MGLVTCAQAGSGWFLGAGAGLSENRDYDCIGCGAVTSLDDSGTAYRLFGGYRLGTYVSFLGGYARLADTEASGPLPFTDKLEVDGFYGGVQGHLPLGPVEAFATLGLYRWNQDVTFNAASGSFDGTDPMFGLGVSYGFGAQAQVKLQAEWTRFKDVGTNDPALGHLDDYDLFTINFVYQFAP
jgi:predicted porin